MKTLYHPEESRGRARYDWLETRYSFSFANYYHPDKIHFGALRVLNDDIVAGGTGFDLHPHDNMEIITIVTEGELLHTDSMKNTGVIHADEVQVMTAGTGIFHAEHNNLPDKPVKLFQIWIFPDKKNLTPRYDQKKFDPEQQLNQWQTLVSPDQPESLTIHQAAWINRIRLQKGNKVDYSLHLENNGVYIFLIKGKINVAEHELKERDGLGIWEIPSLEILSLEDADILLLEIPMF